MTIDNDPVEQHPHVTTNPFHRGFYSWVVAKNASTWKLIGSGIICIVAVALSIYGWVSAEDRKIVLLIQFCCFAAITPTVLHIFHLYRQANAGEFWFSDRSPSSKERVYQERKGRMPGLEHECADVSVLNRLKRFTVSDGTGKERHAVVIEIEWDASDNFQPTVYLYKDTGEMQTDVNHLRARRSSIRLDFSKNGRAIRYIDANVLNNSTYNYYAWIEALFYEQLVLVDMDKRAHVVKFSESASEFVERKLTQYEIDQKLKRATEPQPPPLSLAEKVMAKLQATMNQHKSARDAIAALEDGLAQVEGTLSGREIAVIRAQMMQFIHNEFKQ